MAAADVVMLAYAESLGLPYVELEDVGVEEELVPRVPPTLARQHSCVPVMVDEGQLLMASPNPLIPDVEEELRLRFNMPVRSVLCTPASINKVVAQYYPRDAIGAAPVAAAPKKPAAKAAQPAPRQEQSRPLSRDEKIKRHGMLAVIGFNLAVILCVIVFVSLRGGLVRLGVWDFVITILLGLVVAAATFGVTTKLDL